MHILSPVKEIEEIIPLIESGADEFYCGLLGNLNNRPNKESHNFKNIEELEKAVNIIHKYGKKMFLTVNKPYLNIKKALVQIKDTENIGVDGFIVSSISLIKKLKGKNIHLSCTQPVLNSYAVKYFQKLGVEKICLPRHLSINEIKKIKENSNAKIDVFILNGMCINIEGHCNLHNFTSQNMPCHFFDEPKINSPDKACGICFLKQLKEVGIHSVKIEGRHNHLKKKINDVKFVKEALNNIEKEDFTNFSKELFKKYFKEECKSKYCYY